MDHDINPSVVTPSNGPEGAKCCRLDASSGLSVEGCRAEVFRSSSCVLVLVIVSAGFRTDFDDRQRLPIENGHGGFSADNSLFHEHFGIETEGFFQGAGPIGHVIDKLQAHTGALPD